LSGGLGGLISSLKFHAMPEMVVTCPDGCGGGQVT
jgi:hypothetical protein